ncbi:hypothetical protein EJ08DRAFT_458569 [Tothia fuscella]|uniref:Uncharacterized protein n=1 Tax=Tothia fuscella TaxID=1048955 RepID=A0A9P4NIK6_9PEZI|nr:hypothetical protein EJ08DRAFT_458569 [Tothia fuscella]
MAAQLNYYNTMKDEIDSQVTKGDASGIWKTFEGYSKIVSSGVSGYSRDAQTLEAQLHLLWYILMQGTRNTEPESLGHYHMVHTILYMRELGTISQEAVVEEVSTPGKKLWTDLPYLIDDIEIAWRQSNTNPMQTRNFVAFLAKMLAVGIEENDLAELARESLYGATQEEASRLSRIDNLHIALTWFTYASDKITTISCRSLYGMSPGGWLALQEKLAGLAAGNDGEVAFLALEVYLKLYECAWRT